jgi:hypothetical protein
LLEDAGFRLAGIGTKGIHLTPKDHSSKRKSFSKHLSNGAITYVERALDFFVRHTRRGHRLKVLAEKI